MRRHPNRLSTTHEDFVLKGLSRRPVRTLPKRGPKKQRRWPLLHYTIEPGLGVVFHKTE